MTNKLKYFIGNWKMFGDIASFKIIEKINKFTQKDKNINNKKVIFCVPNTLLQFFNKNLKSTSISLGAQNCHHKEGYGSFTGSVSASMLRNVGAKYVIIGHSENRSDGETNQKIKEKINSALKQKLNVIFCFGETINDKKQGKTFSIITKQIRSALNNKTDNSKLLLAYEPVWAIGTNKTPKIQELRKIIKFIKKDFKKTFKWKKFPKVLYGGSINPENISYFSSINEIDGFLVGGASQYPNKFIAIIKNYYK
jgi:triosephosphate isomerase